LSSGVPHSQANEAQSEEIDYEAEPFAHTMPVLGPLFSKLSGALFSCLALISAAISFALFRLSENYVLKGRKYGVLLSIVFLPVSGFLGAFSFFLLFRAFGFSFI